jgi:hypothetical protein
MTRKLKAGFIGVAVSIRQDGEGIGHQTRRSSMDWEGSSRMIKSHERTIYFHIDTKPMKRGGTDESNTSEADTANETNATKCNVPAL